VETVETGWNRLAPDPGDLAGALEGALAVDRVAPRPALYGDGHAAARIVEAIERAFTSSTARAARPEASVAS
jgi:UDP-N-acetylglucosamine 2-epimerase